ncbi:M48 family metalloprotease [Croceicoccus mobilis]|uniref:Peptidase M48 domain-containing protein n=1 Tax=Croceicoccus mobilis TaxID=1703339 RepID=A0A916YTC9_9SPHN|nr:M48 family metalloprotease [Croceicoccus mobilis]GGD60594.1 hypothetical protein GCM10010990_07570 [Croceicoccus mobilis]
MIRAWAAWAALGCAALCAPAQAQDTGDNAYARMQALDAHIQTIGWRLVSSNAPFCKRTHPAIGLLLSDSKSWKDPEAMQAALGLSNEISVGAVAAGSPAWAAGLQSRDPVLALAGMDRFPESKAGDYRRLTALHDRIDKALQDKGTLSITVDRASGAKTLSIPAETVCASRFEITSNGRSAKADGQRVLVSESLVDELTDEETLAAAIAHELAHNLLRHPQKRTEEGKGWGKIRHNEREADRLSVWLLANAGYDTDAAVRFQHDWIRPRDQGIFAPTHDAWDERIEIIEQERALIADLAAQGTPPGSFDWSGRFPMRREDAKP